MHPQSEEITNAFYIRERVNSNIRSETNTAYSVYCNTRNAKGKLCPIRFICNLAKVEIGIEKNTPMGATIQNRSLKN